LLTAFNEFSYDRFHENGDRIYRVYREKYRAQGVEREANMPAPMRAAVQDELPEAEGLARILGHVAVVERAGEFYRESIRYVDPDFFEMFSFSLLEGKASQVLAERNGLALTESAARRIFGDEDPMGKELKVVANGVPQSLVVTGLLADSPENSTLRINLITRFENYPDYMSMQANWDNHNHELFLQLPASLAVADAERRIETVVDKYLQDEVAMIRQDGAAPDASGRIIRFRLQPLFDLHFDTQVGKAGISRAFPIGLLVIAFFIMAIACINFVNLTLGSSLGRAREVGVRKAIGATRIQLAGQFWGEAFLVVLLAIVAGIALAQWLLPEYNALFRRSLQLYNPRLVAAISAVAVFAGVAGGVYPALVLSRFQAAEVLKGNARSVRPGRLRNLLVVVQFALSILLISCTIIVTQQLNYLRNKPLGFNEYQVVSIPLRSDMDGTRILSRLRNELARYPDIHGISASYNNLGLGEDGSSYTSIMTIQQGERQLATHWNQVDYDYFETLEIPIVEGRAFSREHSFDSVEAIIVNETLAQRLGDEFSLGMTLDFDPPRKVVGVMKDHHFRSLAEPIQPLSLVLGSGSGFRYNYLFVRISPERTPATMQRLEETWKSINPGADFLASFLDENADRQYRSEEIMGKIISSAALLAILLSCMGLFGIAVLVIAQRTKEIGIRKVLGASVSGIVGLISWSFLRLVGVGIVLATPLAWWAMNLWLNQYAFSISVQWWVFLTAGLLTAAVAFLTLSLQTFRAARMNPVKTLKYE
jgi:putative ABC transport system permease protein